MAAQDLTAESVDGLQIALARGEVVKIGPAVSLHHAKPRNQAMTEQVLKVLDKFLSIAAAKVTFIGYGKSRAVPVKGAEITSLIKRIRSEKMTKAFSLRLHGGENFDTTHPVFFKCLLPADWDPDPITYVSAGFSMQLLMEEQISLKNWVQSACEAFDPMHGSGGLTLLANNNWAHTSDIVGQLASILDRFPGLDYPALPTGGFVTQEGPVAANWINILNNDLLNRLGGRKIVRNKVLGFSGQVLEWSNGMMLIAPGAPQIGDADAGNFVESYKKIGSIIAPIRGAKEAVYFPGASDREMIAFGNAWRSRFD